MQHISAKELHAQINAGVLENNAIILDVRTDVEFREKHILDSKNIEVSQFNGSEDFISKSEKIFVVCKGGIRAVRACEKIPQELQHKCFVLESGIDSWVANGFDVVAPKKVKFPLMQQMQVIVGSFSAVGSILALGVSKWFAVIPLIFGSGLTFAGLTGICMLLRFLAKMPWNR